MSKKRKQHSPEFKAKGALAVLKNKATISELANYFGVHPTMITKGKQALVEGETELFDKGQKVSPRSGSPNQRVSQPHMDWYSRKVPSFKLSNVLDTDFCLEAVEEAIQTYGPKNLQYRQSFQ